MPAFIDITGKRFTRLLVLNRNGSLNKKPTWRCRCDCGKIVQQIRGSDLRMNKHRSCGCLQLEAVTKHGHTQYGNPPSPEYQSWASMKYRCSNPQWAGFHRYGGRGIKVCKRWRNSFTNFLTDMGPRPKPARRYSIDRINGNGNYTPTNCRWATPKEQARDSGTRITWRGETRCISDWAKHIGLPYVTLCYRFRNGWTIERALSQPLQKQRR